MGQLWGLFPYTKNISGNTALYATAPDYIIFCGNWKNEGNAFSWGIELSTDTFILDATSGENTGIFGVTTNDVAGTNRARIHAPANGMG